MKDMKNDLVKVTATLLLISAIGITAFSYANANPTHNNIQVCTILKDSQGTY